MSDKKAKKTIPQTSRKPIQIFISYSHKDENLYEQLQPHLKVLQRQGWIQAWHDRKITAGQEWQKEINRELENADIILLLVSPDYIASDYCYDVEMKRALERHDSGEAIVIPIIMRPVDWSMAPFSKLQVLPRDGNPVTVWPNIDSAFTNINVDLETIIERFKHAESKIVSAKAELELKIDREFDSFSEQDKEKLLSAIRDLLGIGSDIKIVRKDRGSVKLRLRLSADEVIKLNKAVEKGQLKDLDVVDAEIVVDKQTRNSGERRPAVFIGSSTEGLSVAEAIQVNLDEDCEVTIWSQGIFGLGQGSLEALVNRLDDFDFAILVLTPDDLIESRGRLQDSARDNVLLELGLFIGSLGRERTFTVYDKTGDLKLPSDIAGVTPATYQPHSSGNLEAALGAPCTRLKNTIHQLGTRR